MQDYCCNRRSATEEENKDTYTHTHKKKKKERKKERKKENKSKCSIDSHAYTQTVKSKHITEKFKRGNCDKRGEAMASLVSVVLVYLAYYMYESLLYLTTVTPIHVFTVIVESTN